MRTGDADEVVPCRFVVHGLNEISGILGQINTQRIMVSRSKGSNIQITCGFQNHQLGKVLIDRHPIEGDRAERLRAPMQESPSSGRGFNQQVKQILPNLRRAVEYPLHAQGEGGQHIIRIQSMKMSRFSNSSEDMVKVLKLGLAYA